MAKKIEIREPKEGVDTLVTQFSVAELSKLVKKVKGSTTPHGEPSLVAEQLKEMYPDMVDHLREKIALLACGQLPPDDFEEDSIVSVGIVDECSARLELRNPDERDVGDLVYFQGKWWIVVLQKDNKIVLKRC